MQRTAFLVRNRFVQPVLHEQPTILPWMVRINVDECGVCGSDLDGWNNNPDDAQPRTLGHEIVGRIVDVGERAPSDFYRVGRRVTAWVRGSDGFSESIFAAPEDVFAVPDSCKYAVLAEPLARSALTVDAASLSPHATVVVIGSGTMAELIARLAQVRSDRRVIVIGRRSQPPAGMELDGATWLDVRSGDLSSQIRDLNGGDLADVTIEATGAQDSLNLLHTHSRERKTGNRRLASKRRWHSRNAVGYLELPRLHNRQRTLARSRCDPSRI